MKYVLAADVGGTKIRLGLFGTEEDSLSLVKEEVLPSRRFTTFVDLLHHFLDHPESHGIDAVCLGVAGPVKGDTVRLTNLPWSIEGRKIQDAFGFGSVSLVNDLQATALSIPFLAGSDVEELSRGMPDPDGCLAVIAPGTGLGMSFVVKEGGKRIVAPSEGGHSGFAPADSLETELLEYFHDRMGQVSYEDLCSGGGLPRIYEFLLHKGEYRETEEVASTLRGADDPAPVIVEAALNAEKQCSLCRATVELFSLILAGACSRLALTVLATGGVYIAGGIPPRILPVLRNQAFLQRFRQNRKMSELLQAIPVKVIRNHRAPLLGAAARALENLH